MKIVLVGHGMVAGTHLAAISASATLNLHGIAGRDPSRAKAFAKENALRCKVYSSIEDVANDPDVDFAIVTTPPNARREIIETLAACGKPILMEKPVERTRNAASQLVEICEHANVPLGIVFQHRARDVSRELKSRIEHGELGDIIATEIRVPWWRDQSYYDEPGRGTYARDGGGVMISQAIHTLDLALWLLGPVVSLQAMMHKTPLHDLEAEDWAGALLKFQNNAVGTLYATTADFPGGAESISIQGSRARAHLEAGVLTINHLDGRTDSFGAASGTGGGADPMAFTHAWHQTVIEDFALAITDRRNPLCTGREALNVHAVIEAMTEASRTGTTTNIHVLNQSGAQ